MVNVVEETTEPVGRIDAVLRRIRSEFLEMPGLRLTRAQAGRLWNLDAIACESLLMILVDSRFLVRRADGAFVRTTDTITRTTGRIS